MTDRQRFWLTVVLAVTMPLWIVPLLFGAAVCLIGVLCWMTARSITTPGDWPETDDD